MAKLLVTGSVTDAQRRVLNRRAAAEAVQQAWIAAGRPQKFTKFETSYAEMRLEVVFLKKGVFQVSVIPDSDD